MGRDRNPGEGPHVDLANTKETHHRTLLAQVTAVDTQNGAVCLTIRGMPSGGRWATVPVLWASFPKGEGASWGRYMPFENDIYKAGFDFDDTIRLAGHDLTANDETVSPQVADGRVGWPSLAKVAGGNSSDEQYANLQDFRPLERGEYDFMSTGGSYIYGNNVGQLYLSGGPTNFITLDKPQDEIHASTDTYIWESHGFAEVRWGIVKRSLPSSPGESVVYPRITGVEPIPDQEFGVTLNNSAAGGLSYKIAQMSMGAVTTSFGTPDVTGTGFKRLSMATYSGIETVGLGLWDYSVDNTGSTYENILTGTVVSLNAPLASRSEILANHSMTASGAVALTIGGAASMEAGGLMSFVAGASITALAPLISLNLGVPGVGGVILGGAWNLAMAPATAAAAAAAAAAIGPLGALPPAGPLPAVVAALKLVAADLTAIQAWFIAFNATMAIATSKTVAVGP